MPQLLSNELTHLPRQGGRVARTCADAVDASRAVNAAAHWHVDNLILLCESTMKNADYSLQMSVSDARAGGAPPA